MYLAVGRVMIEYIVIGGVNDSPETAHKLGSLFLNKDVIINLIPYPFYFSKLSKLLMYLFYL